MRARKTVYKDAEQVLANVEWNDGWMKAWERGKLNPKDMPDETSRNLAELVDMWLSLALNRWEKLEDHLEEERKRERSLAAN